MRKSVQGIVTGDTVKITASDRKSLIRLAHSLPKGDKSRRAILAGLQKQGADSFSEVMKDAVRLFGNQVTLDEEMDGNIVVVVDEREAELKYRQWIRIWPKGEMVEDGIATGVYG